jgi:hypothetical protein
MRAAGRSVCATGASPRSAALSRKGAREGSYLENHHRGIEDVSEVDLLVETGAGMSCPQSNCRLGPDIAAEHRRG